MKHTSLLTCITLAALTVCLSACGGGKSTPPTASAPVAGASGSDSAAPLSLKDQIAKLEDSGALPKLDRSSSVAGPDTNSNGVRDDIEAYIAGLPITEIQKKAAMQKAKALQMTLAVDLTDKVALQKVGDALMASSKCLFSADRPNSDYFNMVDKIEGMTANTKERSAQYMKYNAARSGSTTSLPSGDSCVK